MDKVVHFEIPYNDKDRAMKFYGEIFGWGLQDMGPKMGDYILAQAAATDSERMVQDKGAINGALSKKDKLNFVTRIYIQVESIEDAMQKIEGAGGISGSDIMPIPNGRMKLFIDSEGNSIGLVDSKKMPMPGI